MCFQVSLSCVKSSNKSRTYVRLTKDDIKEIGNVKFVNYFSDNREIFVYDAWRISQFLWCPCILTKYLHKLDVRSSLQRINVKSVIDPVLVCFCIYPLAFGCCAPQTQLEIVIFSVFIQKSWKTQKSNKFAAKFSKKMGFQSLHQNASRLLNY